MSQLIDGGQQTWNEFGALAAGLVLLQQQVAESLREGINDGQGGVSLEVSAEFDLLLRLEVVAVPAHEGEQTAVLAGHRIDLSPAGKKAMVDEANDVKAVGDNAGVGEVLPNHGAIGGGEVHAYDTDPLLALQAL